MTLNSIKRKEHLVEKMKKFDDMIEHGIYLKDEIKHRQNMLDNERRTYRGEVDEIVDTLMEELNAKDKGGESEAVAMLEQPDNDGNLPFNSLSVDNWLSGLYVCMYVCMYCLCI